MQKYVHLLASEQVVIAFYLFVVEPHRLEMPQRVPLFSDPFRLLRKRVGKQTWFSCLADDVKISRIGSLHRISKHGEHGCPRYVLPDLRGGMGQVKVIDAC